MCRPFRIDGGRHIEIGAGVFMQRGAWLFADARQRRDVLLRIDRGSVLGYNNHIAALGSVILEANVLTANNVFITDGTHAYDDICIPVILQPVRFTAPVKIGSGSWLGENVCVLGACVGQNCVIGANSVVTRDIPDYSVAVGAPAKVIKRYDIGAKKWVDVIR